MTSLKLAKFSGKEGTSLKLMRKITSVTAALGLASYYYNFLEGKLRKVLNDSFSLTFSN